MADKVAGLTALYATMMALFHRERTGEGQEVEVAMFETMASFMLVEHANGAMFDPPLGPALYPRAVAPNRRPYRTSDGYIAALIYNDKQWNAFVEAVQPPWASELYSPRSSSGHARSTPSTGCWRETLQAAHDAGVAGAVPRARHPGRAAAHARRAVRQSASQRRRLVRDGGHAARSGALSGRADLVFADAGPVAGPAPELGADTAEVLDELGLAVDGKPRHALTTAACRYDAGAELADDESLKVAIANEGV